MAAGADANIAIPGTWTAADGNYTIQLTVAPDKNEIAGKRENNTSSASLAVYAQRGASMPYFRYDTDEAVRGGGAVLKSAPTFDQALTASEASGQNTSRCLQAAPIWNGRLNRGKAGTA
ncbi:hypothetical protein HMSSN036_06340 [Paenibacillus macerans]|nr:hypothetical protein HMSSN036_06340 [Paenibacillus macerans]